MPNFASRNQSGYQYCLSDSSVGLKIPVAIGRLELGAVAVSSASIGTTTTSVSTVRKIRILTSFYLRKVESLGLLGKQFGEPPAGSWEMRQKKQDLGFAIVHVWLPRCGRCLATSTPLVLLQTRSYPAPGRYR